MVDWEAAELCLDLLLVSVRNASQPQSATQQGIDSWYSWYLLAGMYNRVTMPRGNA
jgi:hypothetical protein